MTPQQQRFRQAAIAGFIFGLSGTVSFFLLPVIGLTASYIQEIEESSTSMLLFSNTTGWNALLDGLLLFFIAPLPFVLAAIFWGFALEAVARSPQTWIYRLTNWSVISTFNLGLFAGIVFQYTFMRNPNPARLEFLHLILSTLFIYNIMNSSVAAGTIVEGYLARTLPVRVCVIMGCVELALIIFQFVTLNPDIHAVKVIIFYLFGTIRVVLLAAYFWIASLPKPSPDPGSTETVIAT